MGRLSRRLLQVALLAWFVGAAVAVVGALVAKRSAPPLPDPSEDAVDIQAILGPFQFASTAVQFRGGRLVCWFGGGSLDLRGARPDPAGATLEVRTLYGGAQVVVPDDWAVTLDVRGFLGGAVDARPVRERPAGAPHLHLTGFAAFGGIGVSSELPEGALGA